MKRSSVLLLIVVAIVVAGAVILRNTKRRPSPEEAVSMLVESINSGDVAGAYALMPASYQNDIRGIVSAFGNRMDADVWNAGRDVFFELSDLASMKSGLVAEVLQSQTGMPAGELASVVTDIAPKVKRVVANLSLDTLRKGKVDEVLAMPEMSFLSAIMEHELPAAMRYSVSNVVVNMDGTLLAVTTNSMGHVQNTIFTRIDGAWVPQYLAEEWDEMVKSAMDGIADIDISQTDKRDFIMRARLIRLTINQAKSVDSGPQILQTAIMPALSYLIGMSYYIPAPPSEAEPAATK